MCGDSILLLQDFCSALLLRQEWWLCVRNKSRCVTAVHADKAFNATIALYAYSSLYENTSAPEEYMRQHCPQDTLPLQ